MAFRVECNCGARMIVRDELLGVTKPCPKCKQPIAMAPATQSIQPNSFPVKGLQPTSRSLLMIGSVAASVLVIGLCLSFGLQSPQAVNSEARTLSETLEQSLKPLPRIGELSPATAVPSQSPTTTPQTGNTEPHFTSIQEGLLIAVMNAQIPDNPIPPDRFQLSTVKGDATPDRVALYENIDHGMYLMLTGSPDDLVMVSLLIPLDRFVGEVDGKATGVGAEAFSRCVLRLGTVADRSWAPQLYTWMNENMARALVVPEGVTLSHKRLMAKFSTFEMPHTKLMVSMTIGIAAETTSP